MAEVIWGLATSHVPSIGAAMDRQKTEDPNWKALFDGYAPARAWLAEHRPDVAIVVYNDHANGIDLDFVPTFGLGTAERYRVADEGFGPRQVPDVVGDPDLSLHLVESLIDEGFDLTVFQELDVDHGLTVPLSVWTPDPGDAWPCPVVPVLVNVIQYPQPTAARCYALGQALGRAIRSYRDDVTVGILGTGRHVPPAGGCAGGLHQPRVRPHVDETIETDPAQLATLSREELIRQAGSEGIELIMWLVMRGAMSEQITKVHSDYFVPASNTAAGLASCFDNRVPSRHRVPERRQPREPRPDRPRHGHPGLPEERLREPRLRGDPVQEDRGGSAGPRAEGRAADRHRLPRQGAGRHDRPHGRPRRPRLPVAPHLSAQQVRSRAHLADSSRAVARQASPTSSSSAGTRRTTPPSSSMRTTCSSRCTSSITASPTSASGVIRRVTRPRRRSRCSRR